MYYSVTDAAASLGIAPSTLRLQIRLGKVAARKIGSQWFIHADEVTRYRKVSLRSKGEVA